MNYIATTNAILTFSTHEWCSIRRTGHFCPKSASLPYNNNLNWENRKIVDEVTEIVRSKYSVDKYWML
jgi:hypothetical protein